MNNTLIIGKDKGFIISDIRAFEGSFLVLDFNGDIYNEISGELKDYKIQELDLESLTGLGFDPFIESTDLSETAETIIARFNQKNSSLNAELLFEEKFNYYTKCALVSLFCLYQEKGTKICCVQDMLQALKNIETYDNTFNSVPVDSTAHKYYEEVLQSKHLQSVVIAYAYVILREFYCTFKKVINAENKIDFKSLRKQRSAIFIRLPKYKRDRDSLSELFCECLFKELFINTEGEPVRLYLNRGDRFLYIQKIYKYMLPCARSHKISFCIITEDSNRYLAGGLLNEYQPVLFCFDEIKLNGRAKTEKELFQYLQG